MKKMNYLLGAALISGMVFLISCSKKSSDTPTVDMSPAISFVNGTGFISRDTTMAIKTSFKVGITASSNTNSKANLTKFTITRVFNSKTTSQDTAINVSALNINVLATSNILAGKEKWSFKVTDNNGAAKEISFTITTAAVTGPVSTFSIKITGEDRASLTGRSFATIMRPADSQ